MIKRASLAVLLAVAACGDSHSVDLPPQLEMPTICVTLPENGTVTIDATAQDPEGRMTTYTATQPSHGTLTGDGPKYTYKPVAHYNGPDGLTITLSDGGKTVDVAVTITVTSVNDAPVAMDLALSVDEDSAVLTSLNPSDIDNDTLAYTVVTPPAHGTLTGEPPDLIYTPDLLFFGVDTFTYQGNDGHVASNVATVTVTG